MLPQKKPVIQPYDHGCCVLFSVPLFSFFSKAYIERNQIPNMLRKKKKKKKNASTNTCYRSFLYFFHSESTFLLFYRNYMHHRWLSGFSFCCYFFIFFWKIKCVSLITLTWFTIQFTATLPITMRLKIPKSQPVAKLIKNLKLQTSEKKCWQIDQIEIWRLFFKSTVYKPKKKKPNNFKLMVYFSWTFYSAF